MERSFELIERNLTDRDESTNPEQITADPVAFIDPEHGMYITPTVLHAIAFQEIDEDVAEFTEKYGEGQLIAGLRGSGLHFAENATQRTVTNFINV